jgi:Na+-translocating ferredoxin:NAD+ oxidoreductase RnfD subunit
MSLAVRRRIGITDLSALVTGVLLSLTLPCDVPMRVAAAGAAFAIIVAKGAFGGLGKNILNPALCGRVFVHFAFGEQVNTAELKRGTDILDTLRAGEIPDVHFVDMFMGDMGGAMGEISALLLLAGGAYLILRGTSDWRISAAFIASAGVVGYFLCPHYDKVSWLLGQAFAGAFMLAALFMIADPATSPVTPAAKVVYGAVGGALAVVFRLYLPISEGVYFAILAVNLLARPIEEITLPRRARRK